MTTEYKVIFANQSKETATKYILLKETRAYIFLKNLSGSAFTLRVHKKTLNVKGIKSAPNSYEFDMPRATVLEKLN